MRKIISLYLLFIILPAAACWAQTPAPQILTVAGLQDKVVVRRDGRGVPYIEAKNEVDLYFAQGYVTASDRLWQMDLLRRVAGGETAELFGKITLEEDKRWRKFGFAKICADSLTLSAPEVRAALENYARGVNAYIAALDENTLPVEFRILRYRPRPWQPTDSLLIGKILTDGLSTTWQQDLLKAMIPAEKRAEMLDAHSNYDVLLVGNDELTARSLTAEKAERKTNFKKAKKNLYSDNSEFATIKLLAEAVETRRKSLAPDFMPKI